MNLSEVYIAHDGPNKVAFKNFESAKLYRIEQVLSHEGSIEDIKNIVLNSCSKEYYITIIPFKYYS